MINFIVNPLSGKNRGTKYIEKIVRYCCEKNIDHRVYFTRAKGHAEELAKALSDEGAELVVAVGGDGTFHEVLNGINPEITKLGFIPSGRGNDFAKAANLSLKPLVALERIINGSIRYIDYIECGTRRCLNVAGTGMDVDVLQAVIDKKNVISYYISLIGCLMKFKPYHVTIKTSDGLSLEKDCIMVGVSNGIAIGGGMKLSPNAKIDDGYLDLMIAEKLDRGLFGVLPKFLKGKHEKLPELSHYDVTEVSIDNGDNPIQLDGEIYYNLPLNCKIVHHGLMTF